MAERDMILDPDQALQICAQDRDFMFKMSMGGTINALSLVLFVMNPLFLPVCLCLCSLIQGYILTIIRTQVANLRSNTDLKSNVEKMKLPQWPSPFELMIPGLTWLAIITGHLLLILSIIGFSLGIGLAADLLYASPDQYAVWVIATLGAISITSLFMSFYSYYLMINFACTEKISAAFNLVAVHKQLMNEPLAFTQAWLLSLGIKWVAILLPLCSVIGIFFIPILLFAAEVISGLLLAQVWAKSER